MCQQHTTTGNSTVSSTMEAINKKNRRQQYIRVFNHFDTDGDGKISQTELRKWVESIQGKELTSEEADVIAMEVMSRVGNPTDHNSAAGVQLGLEEFILLIEGSGDEEEEDEERVRDLREAFRLYEMEGSGGRITPKSLKRMLSRLGDKRSVEDCRRMISAFDVDGDGTLDFDEFMAMMK